MRVPILTLHAVLPLEEGEQVRGVVPLARFREQVEWLCSRGYRALALDRALDLLEGRGAPVRRPVVLTFDDGYRSVIEHALPVLVEAGLTATLFVVTGRVGATSDWYVHKGGRRLEHAGWDDLERALRLGFEIGSHGVEHRAIPGLSPAEAESELGRSREELIGRLGGCDHFAYPFGACTPAARSAVRKAGYRSACTTRPGINRRGQSLLALRRQNVSRTTTLARFRRRVRAWH
ncbi:MAG: polysaccharide deacetylase family protein [Myxococcota bacterium]